jgi:archaea-specific DNA-binding protein
MEDDAVIFIGDKPVMNYVLAVLTQFNREAKNVVLKARGRSISRAVDTAEIARNRFIPDLKIKGINISTESLPDDSGRTVNVSSMEIVLSKL